MKSGAIFDMDALLTEIEHIVASGTRLNIDYYINETIDEERQEEIMDYLRESESPSVEEALEELDEDYFTEEEIRLMQIKFLCDYGC